MKSVQCSGLVLTVSTIWLGSSLFSPSFSGTQTEETTHPIGAHSHPVSETAHPPSSPETHAHGTIEIPAGVLVPAIALSVAPDPVSGWNLEANVTHFEFAPERINQESEVNEGHAHLYINGEKVTRLYGPWYHIPHLEPGEHELTVTLNTNEHRTLMNQGIAIADTVVVQVPEPTEVSH